MQQIKSVLVIMDVSMTFGSNNECDMLLKYQKAKITASLLRYFCRLLI